MQLGQGRPTELVIRRITAFSVAFVLPLYYALSGGSYDLVTRHEEALVLWLLLEVGFVFGLLPRSRLPRLVWVPLGALAAMAILTLLSVAWTESDGRTTDELARIAHYGGIVLLPLAALNRHTWRSAAAGLVAAGMAVCAVALTSRLAPELIPDPTAELFGVKRLSYPLGYWNATAAWGAMSLAGVLAWSAHARQPLLRAAALAMVPLAGLTVYLSYSRAGVAGTAVGVLLVLALSRHRWTAAAHAAVGAAAIAAVILFVRGYPAIEEGSIAREAGATAGAGPVLAVLVAAGIACAAIALVIKAVGMDRLRMPMEAARITAAVGAVAAFLLIATVGQGPISNAWEEFQNQNTAAVGDDPTTRLTSLGGSRHAVWESALDAHAADPLTGMGPGTFEFWWSRNGTTPEFIRDAHSLYLEQLAELGYLGFLILLIFLGGLIAVGIQVRIGVDRAIDAGANTAMLSMFGVYLVCAGVDWLWELTAVSTMGLAAAAIAAAGASSRRQRRLSPGLRAGLVALCLLAVLIQIPGLVSTARTRESETTLAAGDLPRARELADDAIQAEPWASEPYVQRATVAETEGRLTSAHADLLEAIEREPTNWRPVILLAQVELQRGNIDAARKAFDEARRLHPYTTLYSTFELFRLQILGTGVQVDP